MRFLHRASFVILLLSSWDSASSVFRLVSAVAKFAMKGFQFFYTMDPAAWVLVPSHPHKVFLKAKFQLLA